MTPSPSLVSVIIPAYNAAAFIEQTLDSVLVQTYRNIEVLVVDDGSEDETPHIVRSYMVRDHRVILLQQTNQGVAAARNYAIERAKGEYIAPIDADDVWSSNKLAEQVACMEEGGTGLGLVYSWWHVIDEQGRSVAMSHPWTVDGCVQDQLLALNFIGNASVPLIRRSCLNAVGGYDPSFRARDGQGCEDWDLSLRIAERFRIGVVPKYLVSYRRTPDSMSGKFDKMLQSHEMMLECVIDRRTYIPHRLIRWSRGQMCGYIVMIAIRMGDYRSAVRWMLRAVRSNEVSFSSPWIMEELMAKIFGRVGRPVVAALWRRSRSTYPRPSSAFVAGATK